MMTMKNKITQLFTSGKGSPTASGGEMEADGGLEIRPGGMVVQKRNSDNHHGSVPLPNIKVKVKYGSSFLDFSISSQATFGSLKKMVAGTTGVHHEDMKLIFKNKERESRTFLDVAGVKNGSKIVLIEDIVNREKRRLELRRNVNIDKASKEIAEISFEIDKFANQVADLENQIYGGKRVVEQVLLNLIEQLMTQLIKLDGIDGDGDIKLRRRLQVKRAQRYIETLDFLKVKNSMIREAQIDPMQQQHKNVSSRPTQMPRNNDMQKQQQEHQRMKLQQPVVVTTKWETFDTGMSVNPPLFNATTAIKPRNNNNNNNNTASTPKQSWEYLI